MVNINFIAFGCKHKVKETFRTNIYDKAAPNSMRYKLVEPISRNRCDNCLFHSWHFLSKPVPLIIFIFLMLLFILLPIGSFIYSGKCIFLPGMYYDNPSNNNHHRNTQSSCFDHYAANNNSSDFSNLKQCMNIPVIERFDCSHHGSIDENECSKRGCCWSPSENGSFHAPQCFYPSNFMSYKLINVSTTNIGAVAYLKLVINSTFPNDIQVLRIDFNYRTEDILQVKIHDPVNIRYETAFPELPPMGPSSAKNTKYIVDIDKSKFGFRIIRKINNLTIFDTQNVGGFIFSDQLLQISAKLPSKYLYGLGQQRNEFLLNTTWKKITLFNHDQPPTEGANLYGSHPFYLGMELNGLSNGVLLLNSNAMDILLSPAPAITYRSIGGVLDFFIFMGPSPAEVIEQYTQLVGRPFLPPYWSLGFHLCRFGYKTLDETIKVWNRTRSARIPFDTQWNDLDYMENGNDFTYDKIRFKGLPDFVKLLHKEGMHYMVLVDPGISAGEVPGNYPPYDEGFAQKVFVTDSSGYWPFVGKVWNKESTVFVDFFKPAVVNYWLDQLRGMHNLFHFDGAWIDMNDPSNFVNGTINGCPNTTWDNPPYLPGLVGGKLSYRTLCMSARHNGHLTHYNVHNAYGLAEALVTSFAMQQLRGKRPFVISRSSFPGHGHYAGIWTGDINSTWNDMAHSISDILSFSLFGIPMSGADICGFNGNATVALCQRWSQLGAFYPFSRNHNSDLSSDQDPVAMGPEVVEAARKALLIRYSLLPYLYTLFWHAYAHGSTVSRPMFLEFPKDNRTYSLNSQFLWGPALLIAPVLKEEALNVDVYLPAGVWYDFYNYKLIYSNGTRMSLPAPKDTIPLLLRGGYIIPTQRAELTTTESRWNPIDLLISLDYKGHAQGDLYWDDGDSLDYNDGIYNLLKFMVKDNMFSSEVIQWRFTNTSLVLGEVKIVGLPFNVSQVIIEKKTAYFEYFPEIKMLQVKQLYLDLSSVIKITWQ